MRTKQLHSLWKYSNPTGLKIFIHTGYEQDQIEGGTQG